MDLAVVGNCQVAALVDGLGRITWMCLPRPDGDPVFCALLDRAGGAGANGVFAVDLVELAGADQGYERNSAILRTTLHDRRGGSVRITDFCPRYQANGRMFRPMMLVRMVEPLSGRPLLRYRLRTARDFGAAADAGRSGSHHLSYCAGPIPFRVTTNTSLSALTEERIHALEEPAAFLIGPDETVVENPAVLAHTMLHETRRYWVDWVRTLAVPVEWQAEVIRAAITLKLCTYEDTGAVLAALTTSIPESPDSGRNWDYRYCWLRDAYFTVQALNRLGATRTMEAYLHFIDRIVASSPDGELQPVYGLSGETHLPERVVGTLPGYLGMGPVRVGNQAASQVQHDVYGAVVLAVTQLFFDQRLTTPGSAELFQLLEQIGNRAVALHKLPDAGPWELRRSQHVHTFSAAMSAAGCDRLARIGRRLGRTESAAAWRQRADEMRNWVLAMAWSERRRCFVSHAGSEELDASVLLLPELGLLSPTDPRFVSTVAVLGNELADGPLMYRYRHEDGFGKPRAAFTVCAFWYVDALAAVGHRDRARERFVELLGYCNPVGLLSEDIEPRSRRLWGNFPQTYSLVGLINSALKLSAPWEEVI
jgi:GH15 family glucan-1,4-alpha-glucosidase